MIKKDKLHISQALYNNIMIQIRAEAITPKFNQNNLTEKKSKSQRKHFPHSNK
jgi:hypothetical protein